MFNPVDNDLFNTSWTLTEPSQYQTLSVKDSIYKSMIFYAIKNEIYIKVDWIYALINLGTISFDWILLKGSYEELFMKLGGGLDLL